MRKTFFLFSILIFLSLAIVNQSVFGLFSDTAQNINNSFTAAANFPTPSPSIAPSVSPSPSTSPSGSPSASPSVSPSSSPSPSGTTVIISGNGAGSNNTVNIENTKNCTIDQSNNSNISFNISSSSSTGGNSANGNAGGDSNTTFGNSSTAVNVGVTGGSNTSGGCSN